MAVKKKGNGVIKILLIMIFVTCVVIIAAYSYKSGRDVVKGDFNNDRRASAETLYNDIKSFDPQKGYPKTPEEVMEFYGKCYKLIYGDMIRNEEIYAEVLHVQRMLFSDEMLQKNGFEEQLAQLKADIETLADENIFVVDFATKPAIYDKKYKTCEVRTIISTNAVSEDKNNIKNYMMYNLVNDNNGLWKIQSFRRTNNEFE